MSFNLDMIRNENEEGGNSIINYGFINFIVITLQYLSILVEEVEKTMKGKER